MFGDWLSHNKLLLTAKALQARSREILGSLTTDVLYFTERKTK